MYTGSEFNNDIRSLTDLQKKIFALKYASAVAYIDGATVAPKETAEARGIALGILSEYLYELSSGSNTIELLLRLKNNSDLLTDHQNREVELLLRDYEFVKMIPEKEYVDYQMLLNDSEAIWHKAKENNDFQMFLPYLEKVFDYNIRFAKYYKPDEDPYDTTLGIYEKGLTTKQLDAFFNTLKESIIPLIKKISECSQIDDTKINGYFPIDKQRQLTEYIMDFMGIDRNHCNCGETEHPFTEGLSKDDVRITTHYYDDNFISSMYSVIHEGGHALYELNGADEHKYTAVAGGSSMSIHECQSRFYENIIGRSREFSSVVLPKIKELFPELSEMSSDEFYKIVNRAYPSLIRTEADELTYSLHIIIRYEIEKNVFSGKLAVKDIPEEWNRLYSEYLGINVPNDSEGCLQDMHWSGGSVGYFPSYALGSAYGAQILEVMKKDLDFGKEISSGSLNNITEWLTEHIFKNAQMYDPKDLFEKVCGEEFNPKYYTDYLISKYSELYNI